MKKANYLLAIVSLVLMSAPSVVSEELVLTGDLLTHINNGVALEKSGKNSQAILEFEKAEKVDPNHQLVLFNLGQAYQLAGRNGDALKKYQKYLSLYPKGQYVPMIGNMVRVMQTQLLLTKGVSSKGQDNYLNEAIAPGACRWEAGRMPISVYVANGEGVDGYKTEYLELLKEAFKQWADASQGIVKIAYVDDEGHALIKCRWTASSKDLANPAEGGQAFVQKTLQGQAVAADVLICTKPSIQTNEVSMSQFMKHVCLHEVGHALGLTGHSSDSTDVMFSVVNFESVTGKLTERDKKTLLALYQLNSNTASESHVRK